MMVWKSVRPADDAAGRDELAGSNARTKLENGSSGWLGDVQKRRVEPDILITISDEKAPTRWQAEKADHPSAPFVQVRNMKRREEVVVL